MADDPNSIQTQQGPASGASSTGPDSVVLFEQNEDDRGIYLTLLDHLGVRVLEARTFEQVLILAERAESFLFVLAPLDGRPRLESEAFEDGDFLRLIRALKGPRHSAATPVLVLTAHVDAPFRERLIAAGADAILLKPATLCNFTEVVASLLTGDASVRCRTATARLRR
jgi:DNA-binding NarL/FixJ family response regulator